MKQWIANYNLYDVPRLRRHFPDATVVIDLLLLHREARRCRRRRGTRRRSRRASLRESTRLGLVSRAPPGAGCLRLTPVGYEVANFSKEYCNWVDGGRALPEGIIPEMLRGRRVLDVGCSFGRHMVNFEGHGARACGVELQGDYLRLSRLFARREGVRPPQVAQERCEALPFPAAVFDLVVCRLVLNYVLDMKRALDELARVLAPDGVLVMLVEPPAERLRVLLTSRWLGNWRGQAFNIVGFVNTMVLRPTGRQFRIATRGRMHAQHSTAWPSLGWLSSELTRRRLAPYIGNSFAAPAERLGLLRARAGCQRRPEDLCWKGRPPRGRRGRRRAVAGG